MLENSKKLGSAQRTVAVFIYLSSFLILCRHFNGDWQFLTSAQSEYNFLFVSGALLLIFGAYIAEPYFTKPLDVLTNSVATVLALLSIQKPDDFVGYWYLFYTAVSLGILSTLVVVTAKITRIKKPQEVLFEVITKIGQSKIIFSAVYILSIFSYLHDKPIAFVFFFTFWWIFFTRYIVETLVMWATQIMGYVNSSSSNEILGEAIGCENPYMYKVEVDYFKHSGRNVNKGSLVYLLLDNAKGVVGLVINVKQLLNKKWLTIYLLQEDQELLTLKLSNKELIDTINTVFSKTNSVYLLKIESIEDEKTRETIESNYLYTNKDGFVGYVTNGSDINKINFHSLWEESESQKVLYEGAVLKTKIHNTEALYQIIDAKTHLEELDKNNIYGYTNGISQKLGRYDSDMPGLISAKWLPSIYSPVFFDNTQPAEHHPLAIGKLPGTSLEIVLQDMDSLVTHNTAILGILGIGKSCLTFELIKKTIENTDVKIICIDITNEYKNELPQYLDSSLLQFELSQQALDELKSDNPDGVPNNPNSWGNQILYKKKLNEEIDGFIQSDDLRVLILNPDWHSVSKAGSAFNIQHKVELTAAEKTRIISERFFVKAKNEWSHAEDILNKAKYLIVFEEAHSLVPEWNSSANPGDQNASNGTAKIILQGRKYGLGSFVVTQRTANISKSILNQCNTIFALRVFDDTGKNFLGNYFGSDYSNALPTLEERNAIVVGKSLQLKQPVIVELNDRGDIIN